MAKKNIVLQVQSIRHGQKATVKGKEVKKNG
jgi:hypothetical protein